MSVQERWGIAIDGLEDGLSVAVQLAAAAGASIRWAAVWTARPIAAELSSEFGTAVRVGDEADGTMFCLIRPSVAVVRELARRAESDRFAVRWTPRVYTSDDGGDGAWIQFRDVDGFHRMDTKIYGIELAANAVPLTTLGDRPTDADLRFGPEKATGWRVGFVVIRDHLPREELVRWVADAAKVPVTALGPA